MPPRIAQSSARAAGFLFLLISLGGFAERFLNHRNEVVPTDLYQDIGHLVMGAYVLSMGFKGESSSASALGISAFLCASFAGLALYQLGDLDRAMIFEGTLRVSKMACWFHLGLALAQGAAAMMNTSKRQLLYE